MKKAAALVFLLCTVVVFAQEDAQKRDLSSQAATREDVARLMDAMQLRKQMENLQQTMVSQVKPMFERMADEQLKQMSPAQRQKFTKLMQDSLAESLTAYPVSEMIDDIIPIYQKYLTKGDVQYISAFYSSPSGRKLLDRQPEIMRDLMAQVMPKMQERIRDLMVEDPQPTPEQEFKPATPAPK